jgi:hypothetical protein
MSSPDRRLGAELAHHVSRPRSRRRRIPPTRDARYHHCGMCRRRRPATLAGMTTPVGKYVPGTGVFAALLVAAVALLATGCSHDSPGPGVASVGSSSASGGSPSGGGSSSSASAVAYSAFIRNHGVPNYPDPGSDGNPPKGDAQAFGVNASQLQAAQRACQDLYPVSSLAQCQGTGICSAAARQALLSRMRDFATCMRSHGISNWPDPTVDSQGHPGFRGPAADIPPGSPTDHAANDQCHHLLPPGVGVLGAP